MDANESLTFATGSGISSAAPRAAAPGTATAAGATAAARAAEAAFREAVRAEYADIAPGYLNTATLGLAPARTIAALRRALDAWADGRPRLDVYEESVAASRAAYARITGVAVERVALAGTVAGGVGLIAAHLPAGAEVLTAEGEFSSVVQPFAARPDLVLRTVPLSRVAEAVRPETALVAVSSVQSADGRPADLPAIRAAARAYGARVLLDATQSAGWLPLRADEYDYVICHGYKWMVSPHGACFLTVREGAEPTLSPAFAGWYAGDDPWESCYGPVDRLAPGARRFDARPAYLPFVGAAASLSLVEELGVAAIHAHDVALAGRLRAGLTELGFTPVPGDSAIVAVPDAPAQAAGRLAEAGVHFSARAGNVRFALHLHNTDEDVARALSALAPLSPL
ncbi:MULTISPECIES: aminotransferase class V-fold PLP-dependent enzyme [unclassified Streptomyces]|uniref:aminotransferase class V-fold PLP-dependent enzyme n=1 Tax=unclassified Streptomyces TaxID=2593676 RepID=UPI002E2B1080|nr:aminotransferase class V-fold PLP-dependent enzyme [Streptomyces sp. NBC_00223]